MLTGTRQIGKTYSIRRFGHEHFERFVEINFIENPGLVKVFSKAKNCQDILLRLSTVTSQDLIKGNTLVFFDEVQECPEIVTAIKFLVEDGRYDYIETGSLISITKNTKGITIPSEEERVAMYPLDYEEFRWAMGDTASIPLLKQFFDKRLMLGQAHRTKMRELRLYMLVGGMPQAVNEYLETNNLSMVDLVKRDIIRLYLDDFQKIDPSRRIEQLFLNIPAQLNQNSNRYKPYSVVGSVDTDKLQGLLREMEDSKTVLFAYHSNDPNVGMSLHQDNSKFKLFCADTGLFVTLAFWDKSFTENVIYEKLLSDKLSANLGYIYENLVAQMLTANGNKLFYYSWAKDATHNYEIDFLLSRGAKICPIEVKSSGYKTHASLDAFCDKYSKVVSQRYLLYTKDLTNDGNTLLLPFYMIPLI